MATLLWALCLSMVSFFQFVFATMALCAALCHSCAGDDGENGRTQIAATKEHEFSSPDAGSTKYASDYNWLLTPSDPRQLVAGSNVITLSPCPKGFMVTPIPGKSEGVTPHEYVYISSTTVAEAEKISRISGSGGESSCSFQLTLKHGYADGYRVGSASGGI